MNNTVKSGKILFGIQGGKASFNEEAMLSYLHRENVKNYEIKYLYTTENVLHVLNAGEIERGQFAIHNTLGGLVNESIQVLGKYHFKVITKYSIKIAHTLMIRGDAELSDIDSIMTHPQVLAQSKKRSLRNIPCSNKLQEKKNLLIVRW